MHEPLGDISQSVCIRGVYLAPGFRVQSAMTGKTCQQVCEVANRVACNQDAEIDNTGALLTFSCIYVCVLCLCVCVSTCQGTYTEIRGQPAGFVSLFLPCGFRLLICGHKTWQQVPLPSEPCCPFLLFIQFGTSIHVMLLAIIRLRLPMPFKPLWKHPQTHPEVYILNALKLTMRSSPRRWEGRKASSRDTS